MSVIKTKTLDRNIIFISAPEITSGDENNNTIAILLDSSWMIQDAEYFITFFTTDEEDGIIKKLDVKDRLCVCSVPDKAVANEGSFYFGLFAKAPDGTVKTSAIASYAVHKGVITDSQGEDTLSMLAMKNKFIDLINSNTYDTLLSPEMDFENEIDPTFTNYMSNLHLADHNYKSMVDSLFEIIKKFIDTDAEKINDPDFAPLVYYLVVYEYVKNASSQVSPDTAGDDLDPISSSNQELLTSLQNDVEAALSNLDTLAHRAYSYTHSAVVTDDLEKNYQDIITANPDLANVSAVGLLAILKNGDTVTAQGNRLFINGTDEQADYSFSGENSENGIEVVKIWYFENETPITLQGDCPFDTSVLLYKVKTNNPNLSDSYKSAQTVISDGNYNVTGNCIKNVIFKNNSGSNSVANMMNFYSEQEVLNVSGLFGGTSLKTVSFPYLNTIQHPIFNSVMFNNIPAKLEFPNLKNIFGGNNENHIVFGGNANNPLFNLIIPESVENIENIICVGNFALLRLDCKDAKSISNNWCATAQSNFQMCNDWGASINIKISAANWSMQSFIDLMINQLRDMTLTEETRTLTIPSAMLTAMQEDTDGLAAIEAATDKGWTIGGA